MKPLGARAKLTIAGLVLVIVAALFVIWADLRELDLANEAIEGSPPSFEELGSSDSRVAATAQLYLLALVATTVMFLLWFSRAYKNLARLGVDGLRFREGWAIGAWFVPFLNLWRPKQIADDIWRASDPEGGGGDLEWRTRRVPLLLTAWWAAWVVSIFLGNIVARVYLNSDTFEEIRTSDYVGIVSSGIDIAAAVLAIVVVLRITKRQEDQARRVVAALVSPIPAETTADAVPPA